MEKSLEPFGLESIERTRENLDAFETRLNANWPADTAKARVCNSKRVVDHFYAMDHETAHESGQKEVFDNSIYTALDKKCILVFCAACNQGKSPDLTYPHASNRNSFRIGTTKATSFVTSSVGHTNELSYVLPGHEVFIDCDINSKEFQKLEVYSGSSVANALAAGLATLIIECVMLGVFYTDETKKLDPKVGIRKNDRTKIRERAQTDFALLSIVTSRHTDNK
ncbi:hypothetical protein LX36DRAFT_675055 [Colletotrichum falcatum]|nr:hypothetical protein LX36DRAFT_675055 [Colletotrichum falcatum]